MKTFLFSALILAADIAALRFYALQPEAFFIAPALIGAAFLFIAAARRLR